MTLDEIAVLQAGDHIGYQGSATDPVAVWVFVDFYEPCQWHGREEWYVQKGGGGVCRVCADRGIAARAKYDPHATQSGGYVSDIYLYGYPERWTFLGDPLELFIRTCRRQADDARRSEVNQAGG